MKIFRLFILVGLVSFAMQANAQLAFGVKAGVGISNMVVSGGQVEGSIGPKTGFELGAVALYSLSDALAIESGIGIAQKGSEEDLVFGKTELMYIGIPVLGRYTMEKGSMNIFVNAGPCVGILASAKNEGDKLDIGSSEDDDIKRLDLGLLFGAGIVFGQFEVGFNYNYGLSNMINDDDVSYKNVSMAVTAAYMF